MSLRTPQQLGRRNSLYLLLGLATGFWTLFYKFVGDRLIMRFLPRQVRETIAHKKKEDKRFDKMCRTNGTGFVHALIVSPIMIVVLLRLKHDRYWAESSIYDCFAILVAGYFAWDMYVCVAQYQEFGFSFLLHGLICISCMILQLTAKEMRTSFVLAGMISTEISTVFLHLRWFLIQGKYSKSFYFQTVNLIFLATFVGYRMIGVVYYNIAPYSRHVLATRHFGISTYDTFRIWYQMLVSWLWVGLQYYWGFALARSQLHQTLKKWKRRD